MPDISMCYGGQCPIKETCYRFKATPNESWQTYFVRAPFKDGACEYHWPTKREKEDAERPDNT